MKEIIIKIADFELKAILYSTDCAKAIIEKLPIEAEPNEWGDEFYFTIPVQCGLDATATTKVKVGDIGYWPPGRALAIFFGPTPISIGSDPVPASEVNIVGRLVDNPKTLRKAKGANKIIIRALN
ncbi:MAG: cyclophilin-like fold protein [Thermodesulfovibrionales bacterium]|nr:cyclophilin-like fold protein [Thermodesulfovibrionales bacterium]